MRRIARPVINLKLPLTVMENTVVDFYSGCRLDMRTSSKTWDKYIV